MSTTRKKKKISTRAEAHRDGRRETQRAGVPGENHPRAIAENAGGDPASTPTPVLPAASLAELEEAVASLVKALQEDARTTVEPPRPATPLRAAHLSASAPAAAHPPTPAPAAPAAPSAPSEPPAPPQAAREEPPAPPPAARKEPPAAPPAGPAEPPAAPYVAPAGPPDGSRPGWQLPALAALVLVCLVGVFLGGRAALEGVAADTPPDTTATVGPARPTNGLPTSAPSAPTTAPTTAGTGYTPGGDTGPGLTTPGVLVQVAADPSGSLEVVERVRFEDIAPALTLAPPTTKGMPSSVAPDGVKVTGLQVVADDNVVSSGPATLSRATTIVLPSDTRAVAMRYRLEGATIRSVPSVPGRVLVLLPPISTRTGLGSLPVIVEVKGGDVHNLQCPGLAATAQLCGRVTDKRWYTAQLRLGSTAVLAQLNLPDPVGT